jgi:nucleoside diphosphate kinase
MKKCRAIVTALEKENFEIFDLKLKTLTEEEIGNLYFKHISKDYYDNILSYMTW